MMLLWVNCSTMAITFLICPDWPPPPRKSSKLRSDCANLASLLLNIAYTSHTPKATYLDRHLERSVLIRTQQAIEQYDGHSETRQGEEVRHCGRVQVVEDEAAHKGEHQPQHTSCVLELRLLVLEFLDELVIHFGGRREDRDFLDGRRFDRNRWLLVTRLRACNLLRFWFFGSDRGFCIWVSAGLRELFGTL